MLFRPWRRGHQDIDGDAQVMQGTVVSLHDLGGEYGNLAVGDLVSRRHDMT